MGLSRGVCSWCLLVGPIRRITFGPIDGPCSWGSVFGCIRGTRDSVVGVTVRLLQGCGELFRADHSWGLLSRYSYFVGSTRKSWGGLFVIRGVVALAVVWRVVAVYGAGAISAWGPSWVYYGTVRVAIGETEPIANFSWG